MSTFKPLCSKTIFKEFDGKFLGFKYIYIFFNPVLESKFRMVSQYPKFFGLLYRILGSMPISNTHTMLTYFQLQKSLIVVNESANYDLHPIKHEVGADLNSSAISTYNEANL